MKPLAVDKSYVLDILSRLLQTPSPSGFTDRIVALVCGELKRLQVPFELTRRGAVRATLQGERRTPDRALAAHLDTLGAMVKELKPNGRLRIAPVGHWNARFAEGARVTVFTDGGGSFRGNILPMKASGHTFGPEIDDQPCSWDHVELRVDAELENADDLRKAGIQVGDFIAVDTNLEINDNGYINSRHLDDKAGVAVLLGTVQAIQAAKRDGGLTLPVDCHVIFTITEEVGAGASAVLPSSVAELVSVDNGTTAPGQNSREFGATLAMADMTGPFDYHLTRHLQRLCETHTIAFQRDVFRYYRSDNATALEAGNDVRTALVCFGIDASHGYERIHWNALESLVGLLSAYVQTPPLNPNDIVG